MGYAQTVRAAPFTVKAISCFSGAAGEGFKVTLAAEYVFSRLELTADNADSADGKDEIQSSDYPRYLRHPRSFTSHCLRSHIYRRRPRKCPPATREWNRRVLSGRSRRR